MISQCYPQEPTEELLVVREALKQSISKCTETISPINEAVANEEKILQQIATRKEEVSKEIKETFEELKATLDKRCNDLLTKTEEVANAKEDATKKQLDEFRELVKRVSQNCIVGLAASEGTDPQKILSAKQLVANDLEQCLTAYKKLPSQAEDNKVISAQLDTPGIIEEIGKFGDVFAVDDQLDPLAYSIESGLAIPLATIEKERKFKVSLPADIDKADSYLRASLIKCDGSKEEGRVDIVKDNNTATLSCTPQSIGQYELSVTVRGHSIKGSPYHLHAKEPKNYKMLYIQKHFQTNSFVNGVAIHANGEVFASMKEGIVQVFSADGKVVRKIGEKKNRLTGEFKHPWGILLVGDTLYVSDHTLHCVKYYSATTSEYIGQFGSEGCEEGQFSQPSGMSTDGKGNIYVADFFNKRVQVFKEDGTFVQVIPCQGQATDVAVDNKGEIHVAVYDRSHIEVFSPDGKNRLEVYANPSGDFLSPYGIAIDDEGYIFITARYETYHLHVLSPEKKQVVSLIGFNEPYGVTLDKDGCIYVADGDNHEIKKFTSQ